MARRLVAVVLLIFAAILLFLLYRWYDRFPWLDAAVRIHAEGASANCGHLTNSGYEAHPDPGAVLRWVETAHQQHRPFFVTLSVHGNDEIFSSAIVGDSKGQAIEIFYPSGYAERANELLRRHCDVSGQFLVLVGEKGDIPQPHCQPWPPSTLERDHLFW